MIRLPGALCGSHKSQGIPILQHLSGDLLEWLKYYPVPNSPFMSSVKLCLTHLTLPSGFSPSPPAIKMDHTVTYVSGSYRSRQLSSTQMISFKIQPDSQKYLAKCADIQRSRFLAIALTQYLSQRHSKQRLFNRELFAPFENSHNGSVST